MSNGMTRLRRLAALLLAAVLLVGVLPFGAAAASYYAEINGERVSRDSCTVYGTGDYIYLNELSIKPSSDYYNNYDFYERGSGREYTYIDRPERYRLVAGNSVYVALYDSRSEYEAEKYSQLIRVTYSNQEFSFSTELDSAYTLSLSDFDPAGAYGLQDKTSTNKKLDGYIVINTLPKSGKLNLDSTAIARETTIYLNDIRTGKLVYRAPADSKSNEDSFEFAAYAAGGTMLISRSTMSVELSDAASSGLATSAEVTVELERDGTYAFDLSDFDYSGRTYDVEDFTYVRITSLPDYGYLRYNGSDIRTSTMIKLSDVEAGKLSYTLDSGTDYSAVTADKLTYVVYTANQNGVYTGTVKVDLSQFSAAGYRFSVKTDTRGSRVFRLSDFDDPDGAWRASSYTSTSSRSDGYVTILALPSYGSLTVDGKKLGRNEDVALDDIRQGLLKYVPDSTSDSTPDSFEFMLCDAKGARIVREDMFIDRTAVRTGHSSTYGSDALVVWMAGEKTHTFTLDDLDDPKASRPLSDYHSEKKDDGYIELLTVPETGELTLGAGRRAETLKAGDTVYLDEIANGDLVYTRDGKETEAYASFTFRAFDYRDRRVSDASVLVYIDFYEENPDQSSSYTYTVNKLTKTLRVTFTGLSVDSTNRSVTARLTAGDITDLAAEAGFLGGTLELAADVSGSAVDSRTVTLDASLFTDASKGLIFSNIALIATDAGQSTSGTAITNVCTLRFPTASVSSLYVMSTSDFSVTLEKYAMTAADKTNLPNTTYNGGLARRASFYVGNTRVNVAKAALTMPYGKITVKPSTVVMMQQQSDGSFAPALSSTYNQTDNTVTAYCSSGYVCTPYYRGSDNGMSFSDMSTGNVSWATEYVYFLAARNVVQGVGGGKFAPTAAVTRAEFVKMLVLSLDLYDASATCSFTDIRGTSADWAYPYVASAVKAGIVTDGFTFEPTKAIDRQTMALYGYRATLAGAANILLPSSIAAENFLDQADITYDCRVAVTAMQRAGIIQGDGAGHFDPTGTTTRAAASKIICMLMQHLYK